MPGGTLRPFPKGVSGNPGGRRKGSGITVKVRAILGRKSDLYDAVKVIAEAGEDIETYDVDALTNADLVAIKIVGMAVAGNLDAIKLVWAYMDGKPTESVEVSGEVDHTVTVESIRRAIGLVS